MGIRAWEGGQEFSKPKYNANHSSRTFWVLHKLPLHAYSPRKRNQESQAILEECMKVA